MYTLTLSSLQPQHMNAPIHHFQSTISNKSIHTQFPPLQSQNLPTPSQTPYPSILTHEHHPCHSPPRPALTKLELPQPDNPFANLPTRSPTNNHPKPPNQPDPSIPTISHAEISEYSRYIFQRNKKIPSKNRHLARSHLASSCDLNARG